MEAWWFSNAHCCLAPSIWRKLLMQAFICEVVRARTKFGIAIAASNPMIATTIMISTRVKPDFFDVLILILALFAFLFLRREPAAGGLERSLLCSLIARCDRITKDQQGRCQTKYPAILVSGFSGHMLNEFSGESKKPGLLPGLLEIATTSVVVAVLGRIREATRG